MTDAEFVRQTLSWLLGQAERRGAGVEVAILQDLRARVPADGPLPASLLWELSRHMARLAAEAERPE